MSSIQIQNHFIDRKKNTIDGKKIEFGNRDHIRLNEIFNSILSREDFICEIEWSYRSFRYLYGSYAHCLRKEADSLVGYVPCLKCGRLNRVVANYDPHLHYQSMVEACNFSFECLCCGQEYFIDELDQVWVGIGPQENI